MEENVQVYLVAFVTCLKNAYHMLSGLLSILDNPNNTQKISISQLQ